MARILVAEDDPLVSSFIEKGLRAAGHTATVAAHGIGIPVIVLTGRPEMRDVVAALDVGSLDFMTKPFRFDELLARIRERLPWGDAEPVPARHAPDEAESHAALRGE